MISWREVIARFCKHVFGITAVAILFVVAICWYNEMLLMPVLSIALRWAGVIVAMLGFSSNLKGYDPTQHMESLIYLELYNAKQRRQDSYSAFYFSLAAVTAGLMTAGVGLLLGLL